MISGAYKPRGQAADFSRYAGGKPGFGTSGAFLYAKLVTIFTKAREARQIVCRYECMCVYGVYAANL
ncbi:MAG TPA: hypothetical protein VE998_07225 [Terriglobales bacterium]|nr:hypothetical protein [Terriglobales bacterium]